MVIEKTNGCPDKGLMTAFVECTLPSETAGDVAMHVSHCERCRNCMRKLVLAKVQEKVQERWASISETFNPSREYLAAADGQTADQLQYDVAEKSGFIHFVANLDEMDADFWHVKLALPTVVTDDSLIRLTVLDKASERIECGVLTFCGAKLPVEGGSAAMSVSAFRTHIKKPENSMISFCCAGGREIEGMPVLAYDMQ